MLREVKELTTDELYSRWKRFHLDRDGDPSSALAINVQLVERLEQERGQAVIDVHDQDSGALGKVCRLLTLSPKQAQHLLDSINRRRAQAAHVNGNGKG